MATLREEQQEQKQQPDNQQANMEEKQWNNKIMSTAKSEQHQQGRLYFCNREVSPLSLTINN